jgi:hypothetical protein
MGITVVAEQTPSLDEIFVAQAARRGDRGELKPAA